MTYTKIEDYMVRTYGFENDFTLEIFAMIEFKAMKPAELWEFIKSRENLELEEMGF